MVCRCDNVLLFDVIGFVWKSLLFLPGNNGEFTDGRDITRHPYGISLMVRSSRLTSSLADGTRKLGVTSRRVLFIYLTEKPPLGISKNANV
ncbi:unnamed protein product [Phyllotreta striolata]|uniref:Uncharacterized protein n=1 Tax=Phyllotreta striolata TaxID=444603 RepID=A0A9N9TS05_PHYSR|nr:unnamed protein product [Phyllotreta striolata]